MVGETKRGKYRAQIWQVNWLSGSVTGFAKSLIAVVRTRRHRRRYHCGVFLASASTSAFVTA
jgi:hypothetical protein